MYRQPSFLSNRVWTSFIYSMYRQPQPRARWCMKVSYVPPAASGGGGCASAKSGKRRYKGRCPRPPLQETVQPHLALGGWDAAARRRGGPGRSEVCCRPLRDAVAATAGGARFDPPDCGVAALCSAPARPASAARSCCAGAAAGAAAAGAAAGGAACFCSCSGAPTGWVGIGAAGAALFCPTHAARCSPRTNSRPALPGSSSTGRLSSFRSLTT